MSLLVSIANNYPAGSILRVRDRQRAFSIREFEGAPAPTSEHTFLVLDGQQRLTSLYQAFYAVLQLLAPHHGRSHCSQVPPTTGPAIAGRDE